MILTKIIFLMLASATSSGADSGVEQGVNETSRLPYTLVQVDSLLRTSPYYQLKQQELDRARAAESFLNRVRFSLGFSPNTDLGENVPRFGISLNLPLSALRPKKGELAELQLAIALLELKLKARTLMTQRLELVERQRVLQLKLDAARLIAQKSQVSLSVKQLSSDDVMERVARAADLEAEVAIVEARMRLIDDQLRALIGEL